VKFVTYLKDGLENIGILKENDVVNLQYIFKSIGEGNPPKTMVELIESSSNDMIHKIGELLKNEKVPTILLDEIKLIAPIPYPRRNVFCLGKNYVDHVKEVKITRITGNDIPENPIYFTKAASPAIGQNDSIKFSTKVTKQVDYEAELAVIIGKDGKNIRKEDVEDYIFGYTIINDVSARDLQGRHSQWFKGKSLDSFCPMGPAILHKSKAPFPVELDIKCTVNGELRQNSNTKNLIFDIPYIISDLSNGLTLKAGDIISTGTPSGVGMGFDPIKVLKDGDIVECSIEDIGTLKNIVVEF
jgi:2-keto-4-pentenoate hydratase/2-oxohepta-3-ene-1,7-dioic acid hydratase in catechol pathway